MIKPPPLFVTPGTHTAPHPPTAMVNRKPTSGGYSSMEHLEQSVEFAARGPLPEEAMTRLPEVWSRFTG